MIQLIGNKWDEVLAEEYQKEYFKKIILYFLRIILSIL